MMNDIDVRNGNKPTMKMSNIVVKKYDVKKSTRNENQEMTA